MNKNVYTCIYCSEEFDPARGQGDHIIPAQLGEFRNDVRFRRICSSCNNKIGRSEQQFLQCGPESLFRSIVNPTPPKGRERGRSVTKTTRGGKAPEFAVNFGDYNVLAYPSRDNSRDVTLVDQIVIHDEQGKEHFIRLFPGLRPEQLKERVEAKNIREIDKVWLHSDIDKWDEYQLLIRKVWPNA